MRINITSENSGWILYRMAQELKARLTEHDVFINQDIDKADINYFINYGYYRHKSNNIDVAWFTHFDPAHLSELWMKSSCEVDYCIAQSQHTREVLINQGIPEEKISVIMCGADEAYSPKVRLGIVGRSYPGGRKGEHLVQGLLRDPEIMRVVSLVSNNDGWNIPVNKLSLHDFYNSIDFLLIPSLLEGGPIPFMEALACGKLSISPPIGYVPDFEHIEYKTGDLDNLKQVILHTCRPLHDERVVCASQVDGYNWQYWADEHEKIFHMLYERGNKKNNFLMIHNDLKKDTQIDRSDDMHAGPEMSKQSDYLEKYRSRVKAIVPRRYANLLKVIYEKKCKRIMEIGTYDGAHATQMIETARVFYPEHEIEYFGFDLFELLTDEELKQEFSKRPPGRHKVKKILDSTGANIRLHQGNTKHTLPQAQRFLKGIDFIFIDGGHSIETITSDWKCVKEIMDENTTVIFDDYYFNEEPEAKGVGCQSLVNGLDRDIYDVHILEPVDSFVKEWGTLKVGMVQVVKMKHNKVDKKSDGKPRNVKANSNERRYMNSPEKIMHINWKLWQDFHGGHVMHAHAVIDALGKLKCKQAYLFSGYIDKSGQIGTNRYRWNGDDIEYYGIINVGEPFNQPEYDISLPEVDDAVIQAVKDFDPAIIHIHHMIGFTARTITQLKKRLNIPIIATLRDYWYVCPMVKRVNHRGEICLSDMNGEACVQCFQSKHANGAAFDKNALMRGFSTRKQAWIDALNGLDGISVVSHYLKTFYEKAGVNPDKMNVITTGVPCFPEEHEIQRKPSNTLRLGFLGSFDVTKGAHVILDYFKECRDSNISIDIWGNVPETEIARIIESMHDQRIRVHGIYDRKEVGNMLSRIDIGIIPSIWEDTAPIVTFEFFANRIPVIASEIGGIPDFVIHGENGLLCKPNSVESFKACITRLKKEPELLRTLGKNIRPQKTMEEYANEILQLYGRASSGENSSHKSDNYIVDKKVCMQTVADHPAPGKTMEKTFNECIEALNRNEEDIEALSLLVQTASDLERISEADTYVKNYLKLHPANLDVLYQYSEICSKLGKNDKAIESLENILIFDPQREDALNLMKKITGEGASGNGVNHLGTVDSERRRQKKTKNQIAIVRGANLNKWEMQNYEPLMDDYDITAYTTINGSFDTTKIQFPVEKLGYQSQGLLMHMEGLEDRLSEKDLIFSADITYQFSAQAVMAKEKFGGKVVCLEWENIPFNYEEYDVMKDIKSKVRAGADHFIAVTGRAKEALMLEGVPEEKIDVIHMGIDLDRFRPAEDSVLTYREQLGLKKDDIVILYTGRMVWEKGVYDLVHAASRIIGDSSLKGHHIQFLMVGSGPDLDLLRKRAEALGITPWMTFVEQYPYHEMHILHNLADIFVLPSIPVKNWQEQFGMVLIESMACGKAVISTLSGSIPEVVGEEGILVQPNDHMSLCNAIKTLVSDKFLREELGAKALLKARRMFDANKTAERVRRVFDKVLTTRKPEDNIQVVYENGLKIWKENKKEEGFQRILEAFNLNPDNKPALDSIMLMGKEINKLDVVENALREYLHYHPADLGVLVSLAESLFASGSHDKAMDELRKVFIFDPAHKGANTLMEKMKRASNSSKRICEYTQNKK